MKTNNLPPGTTESDPEFMGGEWVECDTCTHLFEADDNQKTCPRCCAEEDRERD